MIVRPQPRGSELPRFPPQCTHEMASTDKMPSWVHCLFVSLSTAPCTPRRRPYTPLPSPTGTSVSSPPRPPPPAWWPPHPQGGPFTESFQAMRDARVEFSKYEGITPDGSIPSRSVDGSSTPPIQPFATTIGATLDATPTGEAFKFWGKLEIWLLQISHRPARAPSLLLSRLSPYQVPVGGGQSFSGEKQSRFKMLTTVRSNIFAQFIRTDGPCCSSMHFFGSRVKFFSPI